MNYKTFFTPFVNKIQQMKQQETQIYTAIQSKPIAGNVKKIRKKNIFGGMYTFDDIIFLKAPLTRAFKNIKRKKQLFFCLFSINF
jgi:hypothetical protein